MLYMYFLKYNYIVYATIIITITHTLFGKKV